MSLSLGDRTVGSGSTLVVAEIGSNHDGDLERAIALIDAAAAAGADAVQFHSFRAARAGTVYDRAGAEAQAHRARVELRTEWYARLRERASACGLVFLATPPEMRSRVLGLLSVCIGLGPIGFIALGAVAEAVGAPRATAATGIAGLAAMAATYRFWRRI